MYRQLRNAILAFAVAALANAPLQADEQAELTEAVTVDHAVADAAEPDGCTTVRFNITNNSNRVIQLLGLSSDLVRQPRLVARVAPDRSVTMSSIGIPANDVLELTPSDLWFESCDLGGALRHGDIISVKLEFVGWSTPIFVHVH